MRILYVIAMYGPEYLGNLIHRELGHEFTQRGHTFDVFALSAAREMQGRAADSIEQDIHVHRAVAAGYALPNALNALAKPFLHYDRFGAGLVALARYLWQHPRYDVILAEGAYPFGAMCTLAGPTSELLVTVAGGDFIDSPATSYGYGRFRTARALMRYTFQRAAAIRVTTPLVRERVLALDAPPERVALIPRNIAAYCYPPPEIPLSEFRAQARDTLREKHALGNARLIAAVGRLLPIKGFDTLLRALPTLIDKAGDTRVLLVGPNRVDPKLGDYQAHLTRLAAESNVADRVLFTGAIAHPDMRALLAAVDVIAVPSVLEGMNKVAVEGAAVGTPSVVTRTAGIADLLRDARAGEIVAENSPDALAQGLARVLCDPDLRQAYIAQGLDFAAQFSSPRVGAALMALCEKIAHP
ncbi:MAG: glycosyltransferase [Chloroflexi bacterium]|nr:glycosyltransferase [Chloroflexota bacterium]